MMQVTDLRFVLVNQGDKLDPDQAESIISSISTYNGAFNYHKLIEQYANMSNAR